MVISNIRMKTDKQCGEYRWEKNSKFDKKKIVQINKIKRK